jgi:hypothetical protein
MRALVICFMTAGLVVLPTKVRADGGGGQQSSEAAEGYGNSAHDANARAWSMSIFAI